MSDQCMATMDTNLKNQSWTKSTITIRDSSQLTTEGFMANFTSPTLGIDVILSQAYDQFNDELQKMLGTVAPKNAIKQIDKPKTNESAKTSGNKGNSQKLSTEYGEGTSKITNVMHIKKRETSTTYSQNSIKDRFSQRSSIKAIIQFQTCALYLNW